MSHVRDTIPAPPPSSDVIEDYCEAEEVLARATHALNGSVWCSQEYRSRWIDAAAKAVMALQACNEAMK